MSPGSQGDPVVTTAMAVGAAAVSRSQGGCYASCPAGTSCNERTGYCEDLPCRGRCAADHHCERSAAGDRCVRNLPDLEIRGQGTDSRQIKLTPP
jgi:hypothetical protein